MDALPHGLLPCGGHPWLQHANLLWRTQTAFEHMNATNALVSHPIDIGDSLLSIDIAVHPVPPDLGSGSLRRIAKLIFQRRIC